MKSVIIVLQRLILIKILPTGITLEGVERAYCSFAEEGFRLQVLQAGLLI